MTMKAYLGSFLKACNITQILLFLQFYAFLLRVESVGVVLQDNIWAMSTYNRMQDDKI